MKIFRIYTPNTKELQKAKDGKIFMIYNFFDFKCGINVNDGFRITCRKTMISALNITLLGKFMYRIITRSTKSLLLHKNLTRKTIKMSSCHQI